MQHVIIICVVVGASTLEKPSEEQDRRKCSAPPEEDGVVRGKFAIAGYKELPSFEVMLQAASKLVQK